MSKKQEAKMDERKRKALMLIIQVLAARMSIIRDSDPAFRLFELAKQINRAENEHALKVALEEVHDLKRLF